MANETQEDLDKFLTNIDDIRKENSFNFFKLNFSFFCLLDRLVQNLSSDDKTDVSKAMEESDQYLKQVSKTGVNRTVINKSSSEEQQQMSASNIERLTKKNKQI